MVFAEESHVSIFTQITSKLSYFHFKHVLSIHIVEQVPKMFETMTIQKITEVNWQEHKKIIFGGDSHVFFQCSRKIFRMETQKLFYSSNVIQMTKL
jgi:hypothetical protein